MNDKGISDILQSERTDRPFTIEFLKRVAKESETLDEFIKALRTYKEVAP